MKRPDLDAEVEQVLDDAQTASEFEALPPWHRTAVGLATIVGMYDSALRGRGVECELRRDLLSSFQDYVLSAAAGNDDEDEGYLGE